MSIIRYFFFFLFYLILSCSSIEKVPIGELGQECFANNTCKYGSNLYCEQSTNLCIDKCSTYCYNDAECRVDKFNSISCNCKAGFTGNLCEKTDYCVSNSCKNGKCINRDKAYICECDKGFMGEFCDEVDPCIPNPCRHGKCIIEKDSYRCECDEGFVDSGYGNCIDENCSLENLTGKCMENASCYKESSSKVYCKCNDNFRQGPNNTCVPADCDKCNLCQRCVEGVCINNGSGYKCEGHFNHRCKPKKSKNDSTPTGCEDGFKCLADPDEPLNNSGYPINENALGYCTSSCPEPYNDSACNVINYESRNSDRFMCLYLTENNRTCKKLKDTCNEEDFRKGELGAKCDNSLTCDMNEYCKEGLLCVRGYCSQSCTPDNPVCEAHKECSPNLWNNNDDPLHRCIYKKYNCKSDNQCSVEITGQENQFCNELIRKESNGKEYFDIFCSYKKGGKDFNESCPMSGGSFEENCISDLCLGNSGATTGFCGKLCSKSKDCGDNSFCFLASIYSNTNAKLPLCVDDRWFSSLTYHGDCDRPGGCPPESNCSFIKLKETVTENSDLDYVCLGPVDNNKKAIGESCTSPDECRTGFCINPAQPENGASRVCSEICDVDTNCSNNKRCTGLTKLYQTEVQFKYCK